jgi:hypothetical protein
LFKLDSPYSRVRFSMRSSSPLWFGTPTSLHRHNRGLPTLACHWINRPGIDRPTLKTIAATGSSAGDIAQAMGQRRRWRPCLQVGAPPPRRKEDDGRIGFETRSYEREWQDRCYALREVGYIQSAYVFYPSIRCSLGQLISPFLSQTRSTATQPTKHVFPLITFDYMLHTVSENSLERAVSLRSVLHTLFRLHPHNYLSDTISSSASTLQQPFNCE